MFLHLNKRQSMFFFVASSRSLNWEPFFTICSIIFHLNISCQSCHKRCERSLSSFVLFGPGHHRNPPECPCCPPAVGILKDKNGDVFSVVAAPLLFVCFGVHFDRLALRKALLAVDCCAYTLAFVYPPAQSFGIVVESFFSLNDYLLYLYLHIIVCLLACLPFCTFVCVFVSIACSGGSVPAFSFWFLSLFFWFSSVDADHNLGDSETAQNVHSVQQCCPPRQEKMTEQLTASIILQVWAVFVSKQRRLSSRTFTSCCVLWGWHQLFQHRLHW